MYGNQNIFYKYYITITYVQQETILIYTHISLRSIKLYTKKILTVDCGQSVLFQIGDSHL